MTGDQDPNQAKRSISTADSAYVLLVLAPVFAFAAMVQSSVLSGDPSRASRTQLALGMIGFGLALLLLLAGGVMAIRSRWHRPLFFLGLYALALCVVLVLSNTVGLRGISGAASVVAIGFMGIVLLSYPILAAVLAVLWFARQRRHLVT
jgi:FtsH-binding integral membrane protein